jgi:hypothetical protein
MFMSDRLYKLIEAADIFTAPSKDELVQRAMLEWERKGIVKQNADGSWDVLRDINRLPKEILDPDGQRLLIRFRIAHADFHSQYGNLVSLEGMPQEVKGNFNVFHNMIESLVGGPVRVRDTYQVGYNELTSLEGMPERVTDFICTSNVLKSLEGSPASVPGVFACAHMGLTTLKGGPQEVGDYFNCYDNLLTSLEGAPQWVGGNFNCSANKITSLEGCPKRVGGHFNMQRHAGCNITEEQIRAVCDVKGQVFVD